MSARVSFASRLLDFFFPRSCAACGKRLAPSCPAICLTCNLHLPRTGYQLSAEDNEMCRLFWHLIPIEKAAALFFYESKALTAGIITQLKYSGRRGIGFEMGRMTAVDFQEHGFFNGIDAIVPVPVTFRRKTERGYNQSLEIARGISSATGLPVIASAIRRDSFNESQTHKNISERRENVKDAFSLTDASRIKSKHILIVDDVVTTGSTVMACAKELLKADAKTFSVISLGYTKN